LLISTVLKPQFVSLFCVSSGLRRAVRKAFLNWIACRIKPARGTAERCQKIRQGYAFFASLDDRRDGREIFYIAPDSRLMAAPIALRPNGQTVKAGTPVALFRITGTYTVSSDGQRFLVNTITGEATSPITVILNWHPKP